MTCMFSMFLGGMAMVYFVVSYVVDLIVPQMRNWNKKTMEGKRKVITSALVMLIFIVIFVYGGVKESSLEFIAHVMFAFVFAYLFHVDE